MQHVYMTKEDKRYCNTCGNELTDEVYHTEYDEKTGEKVLYHHKVCRKPDLVILGFIHIPRGCGGGIIYSYE